MGGFLDKTDTSSYPVASLLDLDWIVVGRSANITPPGRIRTNVDFGRPSLDQTAAAMKSVIEHVWAGLQGVE
ncbi:hypothetical protein GJ744_009943 [Endocarpon pusillum]|uniref:Uncharacterized protein n=1 Tax=Endocarpon pusillum TaxID=364733 RepID=A0A8H7E2A2_9EURO|nr:hypothetical protein GJ744_009943 [Endocarpon pusillum]